ncbi:restriction endonuclease subunit M [Vibrio cholerae]|uniref:type I restriction-modification system subunit M n=1 Tax=Vibrio cholerae TaxID=666 RepID=UPI0011DACE7B|nr:class I SAM-dependent DNA methyltransferase [Vibrio cholerae]TXZ88515.1 SAM-dependent DNA methyltransferase [Vibrio cholerae]TYA95605.1 SAM-dependent DNA methyltransferase [Vibrio cholerae]GIB80500.1 restriction endonuclease subunit M [Vibrio cholerae]
MNLQDKEQSAKLSSAIWRMADDLWGDFKHTDFARIILPFLLLRRIECVLEPTREEVRKFFLAEKQSGIDLGLVLPEVAGFAFYNTSEYSLETLGASDTGDNLEHYISQFSKNVRTIFDEFKFGQTIEDLEKAKLLYRMVSYFANLDLHPDVVSDRVLSDAYEELIFKFASSVNEKAGEFMTPRDAVRLATKLVLAADEDIFSEKGVIRTIYDPTCGTGGFLSDAISQIEEMGSSAKVVPFGQELDPATHAMALTNMMIRGFDANNIKQGNTLSDDQLRADKFHYGLANPPFGIKWEKAKKEVEREHKQLKYAGRFGPGLPSISDGSMLFLLHLVSKMETPENGGGRVGIVLSGSPLFNGDAGSGPSEIRRWLLEQDLVEAIVALPTDMFFNTGIGTYIWILSNHKEPRRKNQVQLINLADIWTPMRKSQGSKRKYLSDEQIDDIVRAYDGFETSDNCKIFLTTDFAYRKVTIQRPLRAKLDITAAGIAAFAQQDTFKKLKPEQQAAWVQYLTDNLGLQSYEWARLAVKKNNNKNDFGKCPKALATALTSHFMLIDSQFEPALDEKGQVIADPKLKDTESIPFDRDIEDYFVQEVLPHVPDAFIDHSVRDEKDGEVGIVGYEINFNRYFYQYVPPRELGVIDGELKACEARIQALLNEVAE